MSILEITLKQLVENLPASLSRLLNLENLLGVFGTRIGTLSIEKDTFLVDKLIAVKIGSNEKLNRVAEDNLEKINSEYLYDNFHFVNSGVPTDDNPNGNQWKRYTARVSFCKEDFDLVKNNNLIFDTNGRTAKIESLRWNVFSKTADINYRVNELFLQLTETKDTPDGE